VIPSRRSFSHVPSLDGLRGVAVLLVMFFHTNHPAFIGGFIGVDIFFVLSGFLITTLLIQEFDNTGAISFKNFYIRRLLRLAPALLLLLTVYCLFSALLLSKKDALRNIVDALIALFYLSNWARAFAIHVPDFLGHTWSLSIEEQFYIVWPITLLALLKATTARWYVFLCIVSIAVASCALRIYLAMHDVYLQRLYNGLDTRADTLMTGCALAAFLSNEHVMEFCKKHLSRWLEIIAPLAALGLAGFAHWSKWYEVDIYVWGFVAVEILVAIIILDIIVNKYSFLGAVLSTACLVRVGSISYGLYLWHFPIYKTMFSLGCNQLLITSLGTVVTFIVAAGSYYFLERPMLKLKGRFARPIHPSKMALS
jgi:peptidoglycan/LPS O-acetylase OafA/YrhL